MSETFADLINRLSSLRGLEWMWLNGACKTKGTAIAAVRKYLEDGAYNRYTLNNARYALGELNKFGSTEALAPAPANILHYDCETDWGDVKLLENIPLNHTYDFFDGMRGRSWQPTEKDYLECCGVWVDWDETVAKYGPDDLLDFDDRADFDRFHRNWVRIEPMPEQCVPKAEPKKESYRFKYPLLAGILE